MKEKHFILWVNAEEPTAYKCKYWQQQEEDWKRIIGFQGWGLADAQYYI